MLKRLSWPVMTAFIFGRLNLKCFSGTKSITPRLTTEEPSFRVYSR